MNTTHGNLVSPIPFRNELISMHLYVNMKTNTDIVLFFILIFMDELI